VGIEIDLGTNREAVFIHEVALRKVRTNADEVVIETNTAIRWLELIVTSVSGSRSARIRDNVPHCV
jgi:hypothetical protein